MGQAGRKAVLRAKAPTFGERKRIEDMIEGVGRGDTGATLESNKNNNKRTICPKNNRNFLKISQLNKEGESS